VTVRDMGLSWIQRSALNHNRPGLIPMLVVGDSRFLANVTRPHPSSDDTALVVIDVRPFHTLETKLAQSLLHLHSERSPLLLRESLPQLFWVGKPWLNRAVIVIFAINLCLGILMRFGHGHRGHLTGQANVDSFVSGHQEQGVPAD
jgi:hypothetical protein